jgi:hypothetical protein
MPRKCAPGVICIENMTLFVLVVIFILLATIFYNQYTLQTQHGKKRIKTLRVQQPNLVSISTRQDTLNDPYAPPLKNDGLYLRGGSSDTHGIQSMQVPVNIETRGIASSYSQVGILNNSGPENIILPLMGRRHMAGRDKWQYYTISNTGMVNTKLPVSVQGKSCTSEYGCDSIMNGDQIYVEGYNSTFNATIYENGTFSYIPQI